MNYMFLALPVVHNIGWVLAHTLWQFSLAAIVTGVFSHAMRHKSANVKYFVCLTGLFTMTAVPVLTFATLVSKDIRANPVGYGTTQRHTHVSPPGTPSLGIPFRQNSRPDSVDMLQDSNAPQPGGTINIWQIHASRFIAPWLEDCVLMWSLGVLVFALRPTWSWFTVRRLKRTELAPIPNTVASTLGVAAQQMGVHRRVQAFISSLASVPMVVGYTQPVILLPVSVVTELSVWQIHAILLHELAHIRRHDYLINLIQTLLETLFFYHPAVWWLSQRVRLEREHCCDECAANVLGSRATYGRALLALEELRGMPPVLSVSSNSAGLRQRVRYLARTDSGPEPAIGAFIVIAFSLIILAAAAAYATGSMSGQAESAPAAAPRTDRYATVVQEPPFSHPMFATDLRVTTLLQPLDELIRQGLVDFFVELETAKKDDSPNGRFAQEEIRRHWPFYQKWYGRALLGAARRHRGTTEAFTCLCSIVECTADDVPSPFLNEALAEVLQDEKDNPHVSWLCTRLANPYWRMNTKEAFLRALLQQSEHPAVRAAAAYNLAILLDSAADLLPIARQGNPQERNPTTAAEFEAFETALHNRTCHDLRQDARELLHYVISQHGDRRYSECLRTRFRLDHRFLHSVGTPRFGELAEAAQFKLSHLNVGCHAEDIEGLDSEGNAFSLSDYRGSVVLLLFSQTGSQWEVRYPVARRLLTTFKDDAFTVLGVMTDPTIDTVHQSIVQGDITWRCWWDGAEGAIGKRWLADERLWQRMYVLDRNGVIRHALLDGEKELTDAIELLIKS